MVQRLKQAPGMSLGVRPEHLLPSGEGDVVIQGKIEVVEKLGNETQVY